MHPQAIREDPELGRERYCPGCEEWWPLDAEFWRTVRRRGRTYWQRLCRGCVNEQRAAWARANRSAEAERARYWRNPEARRALVRGYYERNRQDILRRARERYRRSKANTYGPEIVCRKGTAA